ncbi:DUF2306 domain-containing protein [Terriglobus sp. RCC_193]|uniref:DUF2306 domain-containing protein n=1 Tax=Terriglobus sp. RCC_193 TaxID=3239218 RepID=UPI003524B631
MTPTTRHSHPHELTPLPSGLRVGFWLCIVVAIAVVMRRLLALGHSPSSTEPPDLQRLDQFFRSHASLTYVHIVVALLFVCILPLVYWSRTRLWQPVRTLFYLLGLVVGLTAFGMAAHPVGGVVEGAAVVVFNLLFLFSLLQSFRYWRRGDTIADRRWTLRATAIVLGIATTRPVMGVFFATARLTGWTPHQFFGPAFWIGFTINTVVMELVLRRRARSIE